MSVILDIVLLTILAFTVWDGYRRGVVGTAVRLGLILVSVFISKGLAAAAAPSLSEKFPMPGIGTALSSFLNNNISGAGTDQLAELLTEWGFPEKAALKVQEFLVSSATSATDTISRQITPAVDRLLTEALIFVFFLLVFWLISGLLAGIINNAIESAPVLGKANRLAGAAVGGATGLIALFALALAFTWLAPLIDASLDLELTKSFAGKSIVLKALKSINPFGGLLG